MPIRRVGGFNRSVHEVETENLDRGREAAIDTASAQGRSHAGNICKAWTARSIGETHGFGDEARNQKVDEAAC